MKFICYHFILCIHRKLTNLWKKWNYHGLSTEGGSSPLQLWTEGILRTALDKNSPLDVILTEDELFRYGVDEDDSFVAEEDQEVVVPSSNLPLSGSQLDHLHSLVPTNLRKDERIPKYVELVGVVHAMLSGIIRT